MTQDNIIFKTMLAIEKLVLSEPKKYQPVLILINLMYQELAEEQHRVDLQLQREQEKRSGCDVFSRDKDMFIGEIYHGD